MSAYCHASGILQGERLLQLCIGASIALHALTMLYAHKLELTVPPPRQIKVTLRDAPAEPPGPPAPALPETAVTPVSRQPPPAPLGSAKPLPAEAIELAPDRAPVKGAAPPSSEIRPFAAPPAPVIASTPVDAKSPASAADVKDSAKSASAPAPASGDTSDAQAIQAYATQVAGIIRSRRFARTPREALDNGWQGNTIVVLRFGADGRIAEVGVVKSSGYELLDGVARAGAARAQQFVPVPAALRGKSFEIRTDLIFTLDIE